MHKQGALSYIFLKKMLGMLCCHCKDMWRDQCAVVQYFVPSVNQEEPRHEQQIESTCSEAELSIAWPLSRHKQQTANSLASGMFLLPCIAHNSSHRGDGGSHQIPIPIIKDTGALVAYI